jgi:hypothetical protein
MENINCESNIIKEQVFSSLDCLGHRAVVIEEDMIRFNVFMESAFDHLLKPIDQ